MAMMRLAVVSSRIFDCPCSRNDIVDGISRALFTAGPLSKAYNLGLDKTYVSEDLKHAIQKALPNLDFAIGKHPNAAEVAPHRLRSPLDISLARKELRWQPKIYLEEGIAKLAAWLNVNKANLRL